MHKTIVGVERKEKRKKQLGRHKIDGSIIETYRKNVAYNFVGQFIGLSMWSSCGACSHDSSLYSVYGGAFCDKIIYKPV